MKTWRFSNEERARVTHILRNHVVGFDDAWLTEHHFVDDGYSPSLLPIAGAVAARTTRIRIGTFLVLLPLRHNALQFVRSLLRLLAHGGGRQIANRNRFFHEFSEEDSGLGAEWEDDEGELKAAAHALQAAPGEDTADLPRIEAACAAFDRHDLRIADAFAFMSAARCHQQQCRRDIVHEHALRAIEAPLGIDHDPHRMAAEAEAHGQLRIVVQDGIHAHQDGIRNRAHAVGVQQVVGTALADQGAERRVAAVAAVPVGVAVDLDGLHVWLLVLQSSVSGRVNGGVRGSGQGGEDDVRRS
jgi:hypothetical protein